MSRIVRLAALAAIVKSPGFLIPIVIAAFFGAGHVTDAYFLAYGGVLLVGGTVGQPLEAAIVPFAAHALALGRRAAGGLMEAVFRQGLSVGLVSAVVGGGLLGIGLVLTHPEGVSGPRVFGFYALLAPAAVAWCVSGLYTGSLVSGWHLEVGAVGYGFRGLGALLGAVVGGLLRQLWPVAIGVSVGEWSRVWWLRTRWHKELRNVPEGQVGEPARGFASAAAHQMGAQGVLALAQFLERFLVGTVAVAAISRVEYASRLIAVAAVLFDGGVGPWLLARWANVRVRNRLRSDWSTVYQPLSLAALAALGISAGLVAAAPILVGAILHHGAFTSDDAAVVTSVLRWYGVGYFFNMTALCVERLLIARAQNRIFLGLSAVRALVRISAILLLLPHLGVLALPAGYAAAEVTYLVSLVVASRREGAAVAA